MNSGAPAVHEFTLTIRAGATSGTHGPWRPRDGFEVAAFFAQVGGAPGSVSEGGPPQLQLEFFRSLQPEEDATHLSGPFDVNGGGRRVVVAPALSASPVLGLVVKAALISARLATDLTLEVKLEGAR
jgi:hypothetical protein